MAITFGIVIMAGIYAVGQARLAVPKEVAKTGLREGVAAEALTELAAA